MANEYCRDGFCRQVPLLGWRQPINNRPRTIIYDGSDVSARVRRDACSNRARYAGDGSAIVARACKILCDEIKNVLGSHHYGWQHLQPETIARKVLVDKPANCIIRLNGCPLATK